MEPNIIQEDFKNPDDHLFLRSACQRSGLWYSRPGNGVSHPVHRERFGVPGKTLLGSDSHTCAADWNLLGSALVESGQPADALVAYREGIAVDEAMGDRQAAQEMIETARRIEENARPGEALSHATQQETFP